MPVKTVDRGAAQAQKWPLHIHPPPALNRQVRRSANVAISKNDVLNALGKVKTPKGEPLTQAAQLSDIVANDGKVFFSINVDADEAQSWSAVRDQAEAAVRALPGVTTAMIALTAERRGGTGQAPKPAAQAPKGQAGAQEPPFGKSVPPQKAIPGIGAIIAVASGKGGVGKSTTALNLALGLRDLGLAVGVLDADIYGPSVPKLTGIHERPESRDGKTMLPIDRYGLSIMSIGFFVDEDTPMVWRGPMVMSALTQMLREVDWGTLDVLVVDMPPGTGDAQLTLAQQVPLKGAVIVSTPQDLALIDARRGVAMFKKVEVPVLGVIENMSYFQCPNCGARSDIFGHGGARQEAEKMGVPFLGEVPLHMEIRASSDAGTPVLISEPEGVHAKIYREIAARVRDELGATAAA
jgi:ATP-binding protein involved in chromosome partitioning